MVDTSPAVTSPPAATDVALLSPPKSESKLSPIMLGDILSSMRRQVESSLVHTTAVSAVGTSATTVVTTSNSVSALAYPRTLTLPSSPCVRDVCDAVIVHALRQHDTSSTTAVPHPRSVDTGVLEPWSRAAASAEPTARQNPAEFVQPQRQPAEPRMRFGVSGRTSWSAESTRQLDESNTHVAVDSNSKQLRFAEVKSRLADCNPCSTDSVPQPQATEQATECPSKRSEVAVTDRQPLTSDFQSGVKESKSLVDFDLKQISSDADTAGIGCAVATVGADDVVKSKLETDLLAREADDVDIEDHPLCIDLNRDPSPDVPSTQ